MTRPDPKPKPRRRNSRIRKLDRSASKRVLLAEDECVVCGRPSSNSDHILRRGAPHFGDDDPDNMIAICGSGTTGCHGARHGNPYVDDAGKRWTPEEVRHRIGLAILGRPPKLRYVLRKLGPEAGVDLLRRVFLLTDDEVALIPAAVRIEHGPPLHQWP